MTFIRTDHYDLYQMVVLLFFKRKGEGHFDEGPENLNRGYKIPYLVGAKNESTFRCDTVFSNLIEKERKIFSVFLSFSLRR